MNYKTTLVLLGVLLGLGLVLYLSGGPEKAKTQTTEKDDGRERRVFADVKSEDVNKIIVVPADAKRMVLQKDAGKWKLLEPVAASAEAFEGDALARELAELKAHGRVTDSSDATATGLASPRYKVEFSTSANKTFTLNVGNKSAVGDNLYVAVGDSKQPDVVGGELLERLEKPASAYRDPKLVNITSSEVKQVTIARGADKIRLEKSGDQWKMVEPREMLAENSEVDDVVFAVTGLRASDWVADDTKDLKQYQLETPRVTVTLSATTRPAAATQASTQAATQPTLATVKIGRYEDVLRKNVLVTSSDVPAVAKVAASVLDTLSKKPIELRDRKVLTINPEHVSGISILSDLPATTQPTTKPASKKEVIVKRHIPTLPVGIAAPDQLAKSATQPATQATTLASTQPATKSSVAATQPAHKWELLGDSTQPAEDSKVDDLVGSFSPLRAEKYLESKYASTQPAPTYLVKITTQGAGGAPPLQHEIMIVDPGVSKAPIATYQDLTFEVSRSLVDKLSGDFKKGATPNVAHTENPGFPETP